MAADREIGQLAGGGYYIKDEVDFALKEEVARDLSPVGPGRRPVLTGRMLGLHAGIREIAGGNSAAAPG
jgi:hypothetical protein